MSKAFRGTREWLHGLGWKPGDGKGGIVSVTAEQDFDNGCGESRPVQLSTYAAPSVNADQGVIDVAAAGRAGGSRSSARPVVNSRPIRLPKPPNETESRYGDILRVRYQDSEVIFEGLSFKLASGTRYTPDWLIKEGATIIAAWEVKGPRQHASHARSVLAWKSAAQEWPMILWGWAQWKDGTWNETEIKPAT